LARRLIKNPTIHETESTRRSHGLPNCIVFFGCPSIKHKHILYFLSYFVFVLYSTPLHLRAALTPLNNRFFFLFCLSNCRLHKRTMNSNSDCEVWGEVRVKQIDLRVSLSPKNRKRRDPQSINETKTITYMLNNESESAMKCVCVLLLNLGHQWVLKTKPKPKRVDESPELIQNAYITIISLFLFLLYLSFLVLVSVFLLLSLFRLRHKFYRAQDRVRNQNRKRGIRDRGYSRSRERWPIR